MKDKNKYRLVLTHHEFPAFETREELVDWIIKNNVFRIKRMTFNNKGIAGGTGQVDGKTLFGLWQDVERKKNRRV